MSSLSPNKKARWQSKVLYPWVESTSTRIEAEKLLIRSTHPAYSVEARDLNPALAAKPFPHPLVFWTRRGAIMVPIVAGEEPCYQDPGIVLGVGNRNRALFRILIRADEAEARRVAGRLIETLGDVLSRRT